MTHFYYHCKLTSYEVQISTINKIASAVNSINRPIGLLKIIKKDNPMIDATQRNVNVDFTSNSRLLIFNKYTP